MKALKNRKKKLKKTRGFTLIEVIIALTITGLGLTPLFISQGRLIKQTGRNFAALEGMIELKNFMYTTAQKTAEQPINSGKEQKKITEEKNGVTFLYEIFSPAENSSLKNIKTIKCIKANAEWDFFGPDGVVFSSALIIKPESDFAKASTDKPNKQMGTQK